MGERNYRWFIAFLVLNSLLMAYGVWAASAVLAHEIVSQDLFHATFYTNGDASAPVSGSYFIVAQYLLGSQTEVAMVGLICVVMGAIVMGFSVYHLGLALANVTTNETFKMREMEEYREDAMRAWRRAAAQATAVASTKAAARERAAAATEGRAAPATEKVEEEDAPPQLHKPGPMPRHAYDYGALANLRDVFFPLSAWGRPARAARPGSTIRDMPAAPRVGGGGKVAVATAPAVVATKKSGGDSKKHS